MLAKNSPTPSPQRVALYCRVSSSMQEENSSLATQEDACRLFANEQGGSVEYVFREVYSGIELWDRPELSRVRELVRQRAIDILIAYALDRLSRDPVHLGVILSEAEHHGVEVRFVTEPLDDTPEGQLIRFVRGYAAKVEHTKIKERTIRGRKARVAAGKLLPGGKPMYGYRWRDDSKAALDIDETTAPIVQRIFREIASGKTLRQLAIALTDERIPTPTQRSERWSTSSIVEMLHRRAYIGEAYGWGWTKGRVRPQTFDLAKATPLPEGTIPPLVDVSTWETVQIRLTRNKETAIRSARDPESALLRGGYVKCGYCGNNLRVRPSTDGGFEYICNQRSYHPSSCQGHSIRAHRLDGAVWKLVTDILLTPDIVEHEVARRRRDDPTVDDLALVSRSLAEVEKQQRNISRAVAMLDSEDAMEPLLIQLKTLAERKEQLDAELEHIRRRQVSWANAQATYDDLRIWCDQVAKNVESLTYKEKRMVLDALGFSVTLYRKDHEPRYVITADIDPTLVSGTASGIAAWRCSRRSAWRD